MEAPDKWLYEYSVVKYVPRPERGECINIGLVMLNKRLKWMKGRILLDASKLAAFNPNVDLKMLEKQSLLFEKTDVPSADLPIEEKYRWLTAVKSAAIRVSPSHPGIACTEEKEGKPYETVMEEEFGRLFSLLIE